MKRTLLDISDDLLALNELLENAAGDIEQEQIIQHWFNEIGNELHHKLDNYCELIAYLQGLAKLRQERAAQLAKLAEVDDNKVERLKKLLKFFLERHDIKKLDTERHRISLRKNGGKQGIALLVQPEVLPEALQRIVVAPDKEAIREALENGDETVKNYACWKERENHVRIQ